MGKTTYTVMATVTQSMLVTVKAESAEEAREKAEGVEWEDEELINTDDVVLTSEPKESEA